MKTVCENDKCTGCMACIDKCPQDAIMIKDTMVAYNAVINENKSNSIKAIGFFKKIANDVKVNIANNLTLGSIIRQPAIFHFYKSCIFKIFFHLIVMCNNTYTYPIVYKLLYNTI